VRQQIKDEGALPIIPAATEVIVFDQMLPRIANYWSRNEVEALARSRTGGRGNRADVSTRVRLRIGGVRKSSNNKTLGQSVKVV